MSVMTLEELDAHAPVRRRKPCTRALIADIPRPTNEQLSLALDTVARAGWRPFFEEVLPAAMNRATGGAPRIITIEAVLVGALTLAVMERPLIIRDVARLLDALDANTRRRLDLPRGRAITERMVSRLWNLMAASMNPSAYAESNAWLMDRDAIAEYLLRATGEVIEGLDPIEIATFADHHLSALEGRLQRFIVSGLRATLPDRAEYAHRGDYAIDGSYVPSWENQRSSRRRTRTDVGRRRVVKPHVMADPDARWWVKGNDNGLGYELHGAVWVEYDNGPGGRRDPLPQLIEHVSLQPASTDAVREGIAMMRRMAAAQEAEDGDEPRERGDILSDREYSRRVLWHEAMFHLGFTPHFLLAQEQLGQTRVLASGVVIIDGLPYSPGTPEELRQAVHPTLFMTREARAEQAKQLERRRPYLLTSVGGPGRLEDGGLKVACPASNVRHHAVACDNKPSSLNGRMDRIRIGTALPVIVNDPKPDICTKSTLKLSFEDVPFWQPHLPGSAAHQWSTNRRNAVEGAWGRLKDAAAQDISRGTFRVMGRAKVTFVVVLMAMAANLAELARWREATDAAAPPRATPLTRIPRRVTRMRREDAERRAASRARRQAEAAAVLVEPAEDAPYLRVVDDPPSEPDGE